MLLSVHPNPNSQKPRLKAGTPIGALHCDAPIGWGLCESGLVLANSILQQHGDRDVGQFGSPIEIYQLNY
ncbi:MAG: hypothetical protein WBG38_05275, partial [Nodosilinea sp.]